MFTITYNCAPAQLLVRPKPVEKPLTKPETQVDEATEPETQLWRVTSKAAQPKLVKLELLTLLLFLIVAAWSIGISVQELSRLTNSDAIEHVAAKALQVSE
jgi:hypothetical protein